MGVTSPTLQEFVELARDRRVIPVTRKLLADGQTAVGLYRTLCAHRAGTFLLESADQSNSWSRYSFIGVQSTAMLTSRHGQARWLGKVPVGLPTGGDAAEVLAKTLQVLHTEPLPGLPPLTGGLVGYLAYDAVRLFESIPDSNPDPLDVADMAFLLATDLAVVDHQEGTLWLIANAINYNASDDNVEAAWADGVARLDAMQALLANPDRGAPAVFDVTASPQVTSWTDHQAFLDGVEACREYIRAGDAFQIVLSQRFSCPCPADALDVYRVLRTTNPSPYMYLFRIPQDLGSDTCAPLAEFAGFEIVGSSPEALVTVQDRSLVVHPIAGTRPRGEGAEHDAELASELLADPKERAEHLMLVDLARNDVGRVSQPGSVHVLDFMNVEYYSHVMHLVSTVTGTLVPGATAFDALAATFPAGTLSGAPKPRAMEIIDELEPLRRGVYGGCVGYLDFAGNADTAIAIRTAVIKDHVAYVQAGAGLVADSVAQSEAEECANKAAAVLRAVAIAATLTGVQ